MDLINVNRGCHMKKILIVLMTMGLFQTASVFGQSDGSGRKHNQKKDDGVDSIANPAVSERNESQPIQEKKQFKEEIRRQPRQSIKNNSTNAISGCSNSAPNRGGNNELPNSNPSFGSQNRVPNHRKNQRSFNSQNQVSNQQQDQGFNGAGKNSGNNTVNGERLRVRTNNGIQENRSNYGQTGSLPPGIQKIGVKSVPSPIRDHSKILTTDRSHSVIVPPQAGSAGQPLSSKVFSSKAMTS